MKTLLISTSAAALLFVSAIAATAQTRVAPKSGGSEARAQPRTPWGDPDLQDIWSTEDLRDIPHERPDEFAGRLLLNDEEFAARQARAKRDEGRDPTGFANASKTTHQGYQLFPYECHREI